MMKKLPLLALAVGLLAFIAPPHASADETYPTKPIEIIVPYNPGGSTDLCMRAIAKYATQKFGVPVNVVNKPGGGGIVGIREALTAKPDGYTLLGDTHGASSMVAAFNDPANVPFDWRNRTWIAMVDKDVVLYLVKEDSPFKTLKDVAEHVVKDPANFRWSSTGRGGIAIPAIEQFFRAAGVPDGAAVSQVLFKSGGEGPVALAGGHVDFAAQQLAESYALIEGKKIRALAVVADKRLPVLPDVPTAAEAGFPMLDVVGWHGLSGPPGLPQQITDFWVNAMREATQDPVFIDMLAKIQKVPFFLGPEDLKDFVEKEYEKYLEVSKRMGWRK